MKTMWYQRKQNKYKNIRTNGFDSKKESAYSQELDLLIRAKQIKGYEKQKTFPLYGKNGNKICSHRVDFLVETLDGEKEVHEVKGNFTYNLREWQIKRNLFEDNYPEIKYVVIK